MSITKEDIEVRVNRAFANLRRIVDRPDDDDDDEWPAGYDEAMSWLVVLNAINQGEDPIIAVMMRE